MSALVPSVRSRFSEMAARPEADVDLAEAALLIAAEEYPQLPTAPYLQRLDLLAERVRDRLNSSSAPLLVLQELVQVLFGREKFRGNTGAYYDPRNSFLNDVLDRRLGIPISLSVVLLEVGWRLDLPLTGVNFPGHFLVSYQGEAFAVLIDPFDSGRIRFEDQAQELLDRVYGGTVKMQSEFLRTASKKEILVRMLSNLKVIYLNTREDRRALAAIERILLVRPAAAEEVRDRGMLLARAGRVEEAISDLERYMDLAPGAPDLGRVEGMLRELEREAQE